MHIAAGEKQVTVFDRLIHLWQILSQVSTGRFNCIERLKCFRNLHETIKIVMLLEKLAALLVLALCFMKLTEELRVL